MAARIEDDTLKVGLLMEAAQAQQTMAAQTLDRLREHTAGLDSIVREEIRNTLLDEMRALGEDSQRAVEALRRLQRAANLRLFVWGLTSAVLTSGVPFALAWFALPTRAEVAVLSSKRDALAADVARLIHEGGKVDLRHCGTTRRLCVRIERGAPAYGDNGDFLVLKGY